MTKYIGDGFMAVWGVPEIGPDDAVRAVDAAVELQERFVDLAAQVTETHGVELALRVAVNTGEVVVGVGDADLVGDALNVCARLESECPRGRVVVGEETWRATRGHYGYESLGEVGVKGRTAPVAVYQWLERQSQSVDAAPFVGRSDEFRRLQATMDNAVSARAARLITVVGDPGVGKSRLAAEFTGAQADARVIEARCDVERTVAMAPLVEVLRSRTSKPMFLQVFPSETGCCATSAAWPPAKLDLSRRTSGRCALRRGAGVGGTGRAAPRRHPVGRHTAPRLHRAPRRVGG